MDIQLLAGVHRIIVTAFLFFFLIKTVLLIIGKLDLLDSIRSKTKIIDMVLGVLILATGIYMMILTQNHTMWINIKALMVLAAIPIGIISMKKSNKLMAIVVNLLLIGAYGIGEAKPWVDRSADSTDIASDSTANDTMAISFEMSDTISQEILDQNKVNISTNAGELYAKFCDRCHGMDGMKGVFGATNLAFSTIGTQQKIAIITEGKGVMPPYKNDMSKEEIEALSVYLTTLKR